MSSSSTRVSHLLRRFQLPPSASQSDLRTAYLQKAKVLHPDVAGSSSQEAFRRIKDEYEEAMKLLREAELRGPSSSSHTSQWPSQGPVHGKWYSNAPPGSQSYEFYESAYRQAGSSYASSSTSQAQAAPTEMTAAQRLRNVLLASGVAFSAVMLYSRSGQGSHAPHHQAHTKGSTAATSSSQAGDRATGSLADGADSSKSIPLLDPFRLQESSAASQGTVPTYYKRRNTKSSIRVRGNDTYVSPDEKLKSRTLEKEEGLGATASTLAKVASGRNPSEAKKEAPAQEAARDEAN